MESRRSAQHITRTRGGLGAVMSFSAVLIASVFVGIAIGNAVSSDSDAILGYVGMAMAIGIGLCVATLFMSAELKAARRYARMQRFVPWAQSIGIKPMRRRAPFLNPKAPDTPHHRFLRSMDKILRTSIRGKGVPFVADALHHGEILAVGSYRDVEVAVEHYSLRFADTQYREDVAHTIVAASGNAKFPLTVIRPREGLGAVIERTRLRELATGNAAFDRRWTVLSTRPERALEALQPPVLDRLMKPDAEGIEFTLDGNSILTVEPGYREDTDAFKQRLDVVTDVAHVMPGFMRDQGLPAPEPTLGDAAAAAHPGRPIGRAALIGYGVGLVSLAAAWLARTGADGASAFLLGVGVAVILVTAAVSWSRAARRSREANWTGLASM